MSEQDPLLTPSLKDIEEEGGYSRQIKPEEGPTAVEVQDGQGGFFERVVRPCVAELVGVAFFVFIGTMSVAGDGTVLGISLAFGLAVAIVVGATGPISGAHLNPAVTLAIFCAREIAPIQAVLYIIAQILGGILGASLTRGVLSEAVYTGINGGATTLGANSSLAQGVLCEVMITSLLVLVILLTAVDNSTKSDFAPLAIGLAVTVGILAGFPISGGSMNPARSLGPAVALSQYDSSVWNDHWVYWVGPAGGALLAVALHRLFLGGPESRLIGRS